MPITKFIFTAIFCLTVAVMQGQVVLETDSSRVERVNVAVSNSGTLQDTSAPVSAPSARAGVGLRESRPDPWRLALVGAAALGTLGATWIYLEKTWWADNETTFRFDEGGDLRYAQNLDKAAHFYGGCIAADMFYSGLRWAGLREKTAAWFGFGLGVFVQLAIEIKDGYAPRWGYSVWDVAAGTGGALFFVGKRYVPLLDAMDLKLSYWQRSDKYFTWIKAAGGATWNDDYINQTYWLSFKVERLLPESIKPYWPDWLALAVGMGVDDKLEGYEKNKAWSQGNLELYIALDVDVTQILPSNSWLWETVKHYLNYIKFPAPAIRIKPGVIMYGIYF